METEISGETAVETPNWSDGIEVHEPQITPEETEAPEAPKPEEAPKESEVTDRPKKKPTGYLKKLGRAEAERDFERNQRVALEQKLAELEGRTSVAPAKKTSDELAPPNPDDFETLYDLNQAQIKYAQDLAVKEAKGEVNKVLTQRDQEAQERQFRVDLDKKAGAFDTKLAAENPELLEKISEAATDGLINKPIAFHIVNSDNSVDVADYLTSNPDKLAAMSQMNPQQLAIAFARIEGLVEAGAKTMVQERPTKAGAPVQAVKKTGSATKSYSDMSLSELDKHWK